MRTARRQKASYLLTYLLNYFLVDLLINTIEWPAYELCSQFIRGVGSPEVN